jgi:hypothetical protein
MTAQAGNASQSQPAATDPNPGEPVARQPEHGRPDDAHPADTRPDDAHPDDARPYDTRLAAKTQKPSPKPDRAARQAAALRENLLKRKDQARQRQQAKPPPDQ